MDFRRPSGLICPSTIAASPLTALSEGCSAMWTGMPVPVRSRSSSPGSRALPAREHHAAVREVGDQVGRAVVQYAADRVGQPDQRGLYGGADVRRGR